MLIFLVMSVGWLMSESIDVPKGAGAAGAAGSAAADDDASSVDGLTKVGGADVLI